MASTPTPSSPSSGERIRLTISVTPEVHATFSRMAAASNSSLGKAMGDWLGDTEQAAQEMAILLERAKAAPKLVMREMQSFALGMAAEAGDMVEAIRMKGKATQSGVLARDAHPPEEPAPRPVIRGVKSPTEGKNRRPGAET